MGVLYCGIDEAGYGPMLGPLCVALAAYEVEGWQPGDTAPDLWTLLSRAVTRQARGAGTRIPIADSKKLKLSNSGSVDPLVHLERGVLSHLGAWLEMPTSDADLFNALGVRLGDEAWYADQERTLPRAGLADALRIDANMLLRAGRDAGVRLVGLWCLTLPEQPYNTLIERHGTKAATTEFALRRLIERVLQHAGESHVRIVCDRQGGRQKYVRTVSDLAGRGTASVLEEADRVSRYALDDRTIVSFQPEAENAHMPVALASMTAKLVRELAMARFNRYWSSRVPGLRPTAGYVQDARRWLAEAGLDEPTRAVLVRKA
ncbi:MAG: hypothetical protein KF757_06625 [Phycisphaeraceae bacterium]|nr:hypothetical protein [Phycisphaeraceae bacterium]MCW5763278.1 hypothetical protein [Phycisphaeraceae bacterium]